MKIEKAAPPVWRSMLYVPATSEKFIEKAHEYRGVHHMDCF